MDGLEEKLTSFLSDPSAMDQVLSMARALGLGSAPADQPAAESQPAPAPQASPLPASDPMLEALIGIMLEAGNDNGSQAALLNALRPFVRPDRRDKIDRAAQIAKIAHIASAALRQFGKE